MRGTPVIVKMENPNWSISEISSPENAEDFKGGREKNAKQITWVLLLKAHRAAGCLTYLASAVRRRVSSGRTDADEGPAVRRKLYSCIKIFLWLSIFLLAFEIAAFVKGWHISAPDIRGLSLPSSFELSSFFVAIYAGWVRFRAEYVAPPLQFMANACVVLFLIQSLDRFVLCIGCFWIRFKGIKPVVDNGKNDVEMGEYFPMVLIQMPMCNEREVGL